METEVRHRKKAKYRKCVAKTRKKLKQAALDIFSEKTVDATTIEEITLRADVAKGTLYHHFSNKEDIVVTLVDEAVDHLRERISSYEQTPQSLADMLEFLLDAHYRFAMESREEFLLLFQGHLLLKLQSESPDELEEPYIRYLKEIETNVSIYLSPRIDSRKVRRLACAVAGFVFGFLSFAIIGMTEDEMEESLTPLRRVFVKSLCAFLGRETG